MLSFEIGGNPYLPENENNKQIVYSKIISMVTFIVAILILSPIYGIFGLAVSYLLSTITEAICLIPPRNTK